MSASPPVQPGQIPEIETDIRAFVRQESSRQQGDRESSRPPADRESDAAGPNVSHLIQRVAGTSVAEIDRLIADLTQLRDHLEKEGKRVETEIAAFAQTGQAAASSIKDINHTLGRFKRAARLNPAE